MKHEKLLRILLLAAVCVLHITLLLFLVVKAKGGPAQDLGEMASVMKLLDLDEEPPPPEEELPMVEAIAETMIETDIAPLQTVVAPGTLNLNIQDDYLPQFRLSVPPKMDEREIASALVYPPIAQRSGIEGRVILELFIDRNGVVRNVVILQENPPERGFGEAAVKAFMGMRGVPAQANGEAVSCRYRYPVRFVLK